MPIYNIPELESVLEMAKIPFTKTGDKRKKEYIKLFPTDPRYEKTDDGGLLYTICSVYPVL